jgi:hypothetical protein
MSRPYRRSLLLATLFGTLAVLTFLAQSNDANTTKDQATKATVHWDRVAGVSKTIATLQVVVNPPLRRGTPIHDNVFKSLNDLGADYVRYVPWLPYPRLETRPPQRTARGRGISL